MNEFPTRTSHVLSLLGGLPTTASHRHETRRRDIDNLLHGIFDNLNPNIQEVQEDQQAPEPSFNVIRYDDHIDIEVALPGFSIEDVDVSTEDGMLNITAAKPTPNEDVIDEKVNAEYLHHDFEPLGFTLKFNIHTATDPDKISANMKNGILTVRVQRPEIFQPRQIKIGITNGGVGETSNG